MSRIAVLDPVVADAIAAGEVVERPAAVVKELVENSLDAGARRVTVEVVGAGLEQITVTDDGEGISGEDLTLAFRRHATSKLHSIADLARVASLGFRGEALASIAAVSRVRCRTARRGEPGVGVEVEHGVVGEVHPAAAAPGTWIEVTGLFENTPARRAFLKRPATELGHIVRVVAGLALCHPEVAFALRADGRAVLEQAAGGGLADSLVAVTPLSGGDLLRVSGDREGAAVTGMMGPPSGMRRTREHLYLSVNGRPVQSRALAFAVEQAFSGLAAPGLYPVGALELTLDPADVDVNVHPTKREVRFRRESLLFSLVQDACRRALSPAAGYGGGGLLAPALELREGPSGSISTVAPTAETPAAVTMLAGEAEPLQTVIEAGPVRGPFRLVGQALDSYIVAEGPDGLVVVDQHAAHERIIFNRLASGEMVEEQPLLLPVVVQLSPAQTAALTDSLGELRTLGLEVEPFGPTSARLLAHDARIRGDQLDRLLRDLLDLILGGGESGSASARRARLQATIACHSAVRFGQALSRVEMEGLLRQLETAEPGITCPHGRPTFLDIPEARLRREFHRS